ncbi:MAG: hypothetical protein JW828_12200 [Sedimentisphaerales bacterium]|nr:hypothetical protein [Sedimentisphaerales bacterium]
MDIRGIEWQPEAAKTVVISAVALLVPLLIPALVTGLRALYRPWAIRKIRIWIRPLFVLLFMIVIGWIFLHWDILFLPRPSRDEGVGTEQTEETMPSYPGSAGLAQNKSVSRPVLSWLDTLTDASQEAVVTAEPVAVYDMLLVSQRTGQGGQLTAFPLDAPAGQIPEPKWICPTDLGLYESAQVSHSLIFFVDGATGESNRKLYCVNLFGKGRIEWTRPILPLATGYITVAAGEVFVQDEPGMLRGLNRAGREQWALPSGELSVPAEATETMVIVAVRQPPSLTVLDRLTGRVLETRLVEREIQGELTCDGNTISVRTDTGVVQYDLAPPGMQP